jgi:hypothetical protein
MVAMLASVAVGAIVFAEFFGCVAERVRRRRLHRHVTSRWRRDAEPAVAIPALANGRHGRASRPPGEAGHR